MYPVKDCKLKFKPKLKIYSNSTGTCTFDPETLEARSYRWWSFVKKIKGRIVFNDYSYSNSTAAHQSAVRELLKALGIKIDVEVLVRAGLQAFEREALPPLYREMFELELALTRKGARQSTREYRLERIAQLKLDIATLRKLGATFSKQNQKALKARVLSDDNERLERARAERIDDSEYRREAKQLLASSEFELVV